VKEHKCKTQIVKRLYDERRRLEQNIELLSKEEMLRHGVVGNWSIKDILAHLADWQARMPLWMTQARHGEVVEAPAPGLSWQQLSILNQKIYEAHRKKSLTVVIQYFHETFDNFMKMAEATPEEEIMERGRYAFIGKGAVYNWLSAYAAHDIWGKTKIRNWIKTNCPHKLNSRRQKELIRRPSKG
jgi:hypothetical protein